MRHWFLILLMVLAIFAGVASAQDVKDLAPETARLTEARNIKHGKVQCKAADAGACWGYDPTDKPFFKKKSFWIAEGVIVGAIVADNWSTERALHVGAYESNPLLGKHPSNFRLRTLSIVDIGIESGLNIAMYELYSRQEESRGWRYSAEWGVPAIVVGIRTPIVLHNLRVYNRQCAKAGLVCQ
jgi:hypothetical protein